MSAEGHFKRLIQDQLNQDLSPRIRLFNIRLLAEYSERFNIIETHMDKTSHLGRVYYLLTECLPGSKRQDIWEMLYHLKRITGNEYRAEFNDAILSVKAEPK